MLTSIYYEFLPIYLGISSFYFFYFNSKSLSFYKRNYSYIYQLSFTLLSLSLLISLTYFESISRLFLIGVVIGNIFFRWLIDSFYQGRAKSKKIVSIINLPDFRISRLIMSLVLFLLSFLLMIKLKSNYFFSYHYLEQIALILVSVGWVSGVITKKFSSNEKQNIYYKISPFIKGNLLFLLMASGIYYFFRLSHFSRQIYFGTIISYSLLEAFSFMLLFLLEKNKSSNSNKINLDTQKKLSIDNLYKKISKDFQKIIRESLKGLDQRIVNLVIKNTNILNDNIMDDSILNASTNQKDYFKKQSFSSYSLIINMHRMILTGTGI